MNKSLLTPLIIGIIFLCIITAGCVTTSFVTGSETPDVGTNALDPIFGTWTGQTTNAGNAEYYTMVFNEDGTGKVTVKSMGTELPSNFTWTKSSNLNYNLFFTVAASGFSQQNKLVMNSNEQSYTVIGIEFVKN
ncbi:hypothetical protein [uncultured Methanocorpusculum sp.]|nr:hypothetical protein [uncultured Methanocorpusculum sp.]